jgi:hypothetical protein
MDPYDDIEEVDELPAPPRKEIAPADRELLELAARALGATFHEVDGEGYGNLHFEDGRVVNAWNPLEFSGDTFELGVRLRLFEEHAGFIYMLDEEQGRGKDPVVVAKRAAVRAAAEIGKAMA